MELALRYVTRFVYPTPVWESHNALRACPAEGNGQRLLAYGVEIEPQASIFTHHDRWGTRVDTFGILEPHGELVVTARARVETSPGEAPETAQLEALADPEYRDRMWLFLQPTRHTRWADPLAATAGEVAGRYADVLSVVNALEARLQETMEYRPGATEIGADVEKVWENGVGVCQDFAHLLIALARPAGIAARYVSGYFYAQDPAHPDLPENGEIVVATHAWVEVAIPGWGWWAIDPTNAAPVGERHVKIGHGRDYDDVTPLRGVYYGESEHQLAAEVTMAPGGLTRTSLPDLRSQAQQQ